MGLKKLISIFYDIRKNEWRSVLLMFGLHFILMVVLYFLKPARDSLFLTENGPLELPFVYILLAVVSIPVTQFLTSVMSRYAVRYVLMWSLGFLAINLLVLRWLFHLQAEWVFMAFYVWVGIFGILVISLFWLLANAVFKAAQAKRVFSFLTLGAILGAIAGSEASSLTVSWLGLSTENLLYVCIVLLILAISILYFISTDVSPQNDEHKPDSEGANSSTLKAALKVVQSRYQLTVALMIGLAMIATTFTDYQFKAIAFDVYPETTNLTSFLGRFYAGISLASLGIQVLLSTQIIKKLGLSGAVLFRPASMMIGAVLMAVEPVLASVVVLNGFDGATRYSIDKTGRELLFLPLSQHTKEQTKVFIDIFVDRFSRGIGGLLLMGFIFVLNWSVGLITWVVITLLAAWIFLGIRAKKGYVEKFRNAVQKQLIGTDSMALNLNESTTYSVIQEALNSNNDNQVLHTLHLLENSNTDKIAKDLRPLLNHQNREIKLQTLKLLQGVQGTNFVEEISDLLVDEDPEIRLETIYYLCQHTSKDPTSVIKSYLAQDDYKLKSAAFGCASKHGGKATDLVDQKFFDELLDKTGKDAVVIKAQIADALGYINDDKDNISQKYLTRLLQDEHPSVVRKTIASMGRLQNDRFIPILIQKLKNSTFRIQIRKALAGFGSDYLILYKDRFFNQDLAAEIRKSIPGIFSYLPEQSAVDHLQDMLAVERPTLRYHVIKALNKVIRQRPVLALDRTVIGGTIETETKSFYELLKVKLVLPENNPNQILKQALDEKMGQATERIFRLLGLIYDSQDMYGTYLTLQSISSDKRSAAVEFLDNILQEQERRLVVPLVDDRNQAERLERGQALFDLPETSYAQELSQLIEGEDIWLKVCAIYSVSQTCPQVLQEKVQQATQSSIQLIRETAELVSNRNANQS